MRRVLIATSVALVVALGTQAVLAQSASSSGTVSRLLDQLRCPSGESCFWDTDAWFGITPVNAMPTCGADEKGGLMTYGPSGSLRYCDGSSTWNASMVLSNGDVLDFGAINENDEASLSMTVTGATSGKAAHCSPIAALESGLVVSYSLVTAPDTVSTILRNTKVGSGSINPAAVTFVCIVFR